MNLKRLALFAVVAVPAAAWSSSLDALFYKKAAEGGMFEVDAGKLAQNKGSSQNVKDFAAMMVKDHSSANDKLKTIATSKDVELPSSANVAQMATKSKLDDVSGPTFDKLYIKSQLKAHRETILLFRDEAANGHDTEAKAFATAALPTLKEHMKAINTIAASAGVAAQ